MGDTEFEEFRNTFDKIPIYKNNNLTPFYSLIPDIDDLDDSPSSKSDTSSDQEDGICNEDKSTFNNKSKNRIGSHNKAVDKTRQVEDDEIGDGLKIGSGPMSLDMMNLKDSGNQEIHTNMLQTNGQRRRRKLPEIPKNKKSSIMQLLGQMSLADELDGVKSNSMHITSNSELSHSNRSTINHNQQRNFLTLKCSYLLDEDSSPDSERLASLGDVDSGHSTAHSPNDYKSMSPQITTPELQSPFPAATAPFGGVPFGQLEMLEATHRGLHKFIPRHLDEIEVEIGDGIYVQKEADDLWCEGVNLRTGRQGIFPSAYAVDLDYNDFDPSSQQVKKERYLLGYLGSVETLAHKGTGVVCQAVRKIVGEYGNSPSGQACILEVSDQGLRMVDRSRKTNKNDKKPCIDYFYSLKNVSFCAFHPKDHRYIGFITKHPTIQRFACHVFKGSDSTRPVAEAVGRAFQRFYQKFIETAYPIEDIYIE